MRFYFNLVIREGCFSECPKYSLSCHVAPVLVTFRKMFLQYRDFHALQACASSVLAKVTLGFPRDQKQLRFARFLILHEVARCVGG